MACFSWPWKSVGAKGGDGLDDKPEVPQLVREVFAEFADEGGRLSSQALSQIWRKYIDEDGSRIVESMMLSGMSPGRRKELELAPRRVVTGGRGSMGNLIQKTLRRMKSGPMRLTTSLNHSSLPSLSVEDFLFLLLNPELTPAIETKVTQDMTEPMAHYFIYTGHNSYLKGNQLTSPSSVKPIIAALQRGVRVIELDLWPSDKKDKILVMHGGTLTKAVDFQKCIEAIKEYAFVATKYPVIITLEDHLPSNLQAEAATVLAQVLGSLLWTPPTDDALDTFPSPEELKERIIISTQPPKEDPSNCTASSKTLSSASSNGASGTESQRISGLEDKLPKNNKSESSKGSSSSFERMWSVGDADAMTWGEFNPQHNSASLGDMDSSEDESTIKELPVLQKETAGGADAVPPHVNLPVMDSTKEPLGEKAVYARMITIAGGRMRGEAVRVSLMDGTSAKRVSLSEVQLAAVAKGHPDDLLRFTQRNLLRIYPKGMRVDSSNYNPLLSWTHGAQMVAINMQGYGRPLWLVHGFFLGNGGCGFVKKPPFFLKKREKGSEQQNGEDHGFEYWNPQCPGPVRTILQVRIVMGTGWLERFGRTYFDRFSPPDFYVKIGIAGVPADTAVKRLETQVDKWHPNWEDHQVEFQLHVPELALLRIEVYEYDRAGPHAFGGQSVLPVGFLRQGLHCVPLLDKKGKDLKGPRLLFNFSFSSAE